MKPILLSLSAGGLLALALPPYDWVWITVSR